MMTIKKGFDAGTPNPHPGLPGINLTSTVKVFFICYKMI